MAREKAILTRPRKLVPRHAHDSRGRWSASTPQSPPLRPVACSRLACEPRGATLKSHVPIRVCPSHPLPASTPVLRQGLGLGALAAQATKIDESCLLVAASALAEQVDAAALAMGSLYPPLAQLRDVSVAIAVKVANHLHRSGFAGASKPGDMEAHVRSIMYDPYDVV